ncbi:hypothetical protein [Sphingomonas humi]|uniref:Uncharacterized protein n=1 Tax=Sphingomonas humi TaxID=335630 RepID=A0ABP7S159_9SPHN
MSDAKAVNPGSKGRKVLLQLVLGGISGGVGMFALLSLLERQQGLTDDKTRVVVLGVALVYLLMAAFVGLGTLLPGVGARTLNVECAEDLREQRKALVIGSVTMLLAAAFLGALGLAPTPAMAGPLTQGAATTLAIAAGAGLIIMSIRYRNLGDELMQTVAREANGIMVSLLFLVLCGKSAAAQLGYAPPLTPLALIAAFFALYLLAMFVAIGRRGLLGTR